jgi:hypothetical protein
LGKVEKLFIGKSAAGRRSSVAIHFIEMECPVYESGNCVWELHIHSGKLKKVNRKMRVLRE